MFVFHPSAHMEAHTPCEGENEQTHVSQGTHPTQADKVGHVHRERKTTLCRKGYTALQSSASTVEGSWG